jgi:hypothetical protein
MSSRTQGELPFAVDWKVKRGADWGKSVELKSSAGAFFTGGCDLTMTLRDRQNGKARATWSLASGHVTNTPEEGRFDLRVTAAEITALHFGSADYDMILTDATGAKAALFAGEIVVW